MIKPNSIPLPKRKGHYRHNKKHNGPTIEELIIDVCSSFNVSVDEFLGYSRKEDIVRCRRIFCYVSNVLTNQSCITIADKIHRDHATYLWHLERCVLWFKINEQKFMDQWQIYVDNSTIWNKYFNKLKAA